MIFIHHRLITFNSMTTVLFGFQMQNKWCVLVYSDSFLDYGQSAAPPVGLADKPGRWGAVCYSHLPRQRWTFQRRSVVRPGCRLKDPATMDHVPSVLTFLQVLKTMWSRQRNCTFGDTRIPLHVQQHVLLVRVAFKMLGSLLSIFVALSCPIVFCLCPLFREAESSCEVC